MTRFILTIIFTTLLASCGQTASKKYLNTVTTVKENVSTTVSTDTSLLANFIDTRTFKPIATKFKYIFVDNSGQKERLSVPGPSDYTLEGVLYFDTLTFKNLKTKYFNAGYISANFEKSNFNFEWLDDDVKKELANSDTSYHGHPDLFLDINSKTKLWFLNNKVLLTKTTN